jgi:hypothetical protein
MKAFLLIPLLCVHLVAATQGLYEIKYDFGTDFTCKALLFYYSENSENNVMRIRYNHNGKDRIVEQKVKTLFYEKDNIKYWYITGYDVISVDGQSSVYAPDNIYLVKNPNSDYYVATSVTSVASTSDNTAVTGHLTEFSPLDQSKVTNDYLADFQWRWPDGQPTPPVGNIYLFLVSNLNDLWLGTGFGANHNKLKRLFTDIANVCGTNLNLYEVSGDRFNKNTLITTINNLSVNSNDIIIFYYSGHGFNKTGIWPYLDLRQNLVDDPNANSVSLDQDVYQPLLNKGAQLTIVIGECCNRKLDQLLAGTPTPIKDDPIMMAPSEYSLNSGTFKDLFARKGNIMIATSSADQPSYYSLNYGGDFCNNFISSLLNEAGFVNNDGDVKWAHILSRAITSTQDDSKGANIRQDPVQHFDIVEQ